MMLTVRGYTVSVWYTTSHSGLLSLDRHRDVLEMVLATARNETAISA